MMSKPVKNLAYALGYLNGRQDSLQEQEASLAKLRGILEVIESGDQMTTVYPPPPNLRPLDAMATEAQAFFDSKHATIKSQASGYETADHVSVIFAGAERLRACITMYEATLDTDYIDTAFDYAEAFNANRDDIDGGDADEIKGEVVAGWSTDNYSPGTNRTFFLHTGNVCAEMARICYLHARDALTAYDARAATLLTRIQEAEAVWQEDWNAVDGVYDDDTANLEWNRQAAMGRLHVLLWILTEDATHLTKATAIANSIKAILVNSNRSYTWEYSDGGRIEDISHGQLTVRFVDEAAKTGIVCTRCDVIRMARRLVAIQKTDATFSYYLDNSEGGDDIPYVSGGWWPVGFVSSEARKAIYDYFHSVGWASPSTSANLMGAAGTAATNTPYYENLR